MLLAYHNSIIMSTTTFLKGFDAMTANNEIKAMAKSKKVCLWEIAEKIGMADTSFSRKLRRELSAEEKKKIFSLIDEIAAENENAV